MLFEMTHLFFTKSEPYFFTDTNPPIWLMSHTFRWWLEDYVFKLEIGKFIDSDFRRITRIN
jgi:hypothetical protein